MKIYLGSDHAGKKLRKTILEHLKAKSIEVVDCGTEEEVANYATEGIKVAENVMTDKGSFGIIVCGTGIGISIAANKVRGIRAAAINNVEIAKVARHHNNLNILALGERVISPELALEIIDAFLEEGYEGGRHNNRINSINDYEESCSC